MIELKKLPEKERINILIQCCSGYLSYNNTKTVIGICNRLSEEIELPTPASIKELKTIITMVGTALRSEYTGTLIPMSSPYYKTANEKTNQKLHHSRMRKVVGLLEEAGYLKWYAGFQSKKDNLSIMSCVVFTDKLINLFPDKIINTFKHITKTNEVVEIKDENGDVINKLTRFKGVTDHRNLMIDYNACLSNHDIRIGGVKYRVSYKQVFSIDLSGAGRIYTMGGFQTMSSEIRPDITLDGYRTIEGDLVANHLSILYTLKGIKIPTFFDCYNISLEGYNYEDIRLLCKYAIMVMINCKTKSGSYGALQGIIKEDHESSDPQLKMFSSDKTFCQKVIKSLEEKHKDIEFFSKDEVLWRKLQRLDSRVCEGVIKHFTSKDIPVLCWHDSWLVPKQYKDELYQTIRESWFKVFGTYNNCNIKFK